MGETGDIDGVVVVGEGNGGALRRDGCRNQLVVDLPSYRQCRLPPASSSASLLASHVS